MSVEARGLAIAIQAGVPVLLWGAPGTGKTAFVTALARTWGWPIETVLASLREPSDFAGLPIVENGAVRFSPPAWAVRLARAGRGLLFLDEVSTAAPATQKALLRVVQERVVGDLVLPEAVRVVAAANPPEVAADGWDLAPPLANRFIHLSWSGMPVQEWVDGLAGGSWAVPGDLPVLPDGWRASSAAARGRALVAGFLRARPALVHVQPDDPGRAGLAWPSRRTWDYAALLYGAALAAGAGDDIALYLVAGAVGEAAALELGAWVREADLPDPEELLADPTRFVLPGRGDLAYAVLQAVVVAAIGNLTPERWAAAWAILGRAASGAVDVAAAAAAALARHRGSLPVPREAAMFAPVLRSAGLL